MNGIKTMASNQVRQPLVASPCGESQYAASAVAKMQLVVVLLRWTGCFEIRQSSKHRNAKDVEDYIEQAGRFSMDAWIGSDASDRSFSLGKRSR